MSQLVPEPLTADEFAALKMVGLDSREFISRQTFERLKLLGFVRSDLGRVFVTDEGLLRLRMGA
jgi:hypothetical protein